MGDKYLIQPRNSRITLLAGLYRIEKGRGMDYPVFTVLTRESFPEIRFIHDRMPVILSESMIGDWINPENNEEDVVLEALVDMVFDKAC